MNFRDLELLVWLVKDPNLLRTAERLKVSQSTLTKHLAALEKEVGCKLFERRGSLGMAATQQATDLAEAASKLMGGWNTALNITRLQNKELPYIRMIGPSLFMQLIVAPLLPNSNLHRDYLMHVQSSAQMDLNFELSGQNLDAAFVFDKDKAMDFKFLEICTERMAIITRYGSDITLEDVMNLHNDGISWASYKQDRDPLTRMIQKGVLPEKRIASYHDDLPTLLKVVANGERFATVLPFHAVLFAPDQLQGLPLKGFETTIYFVYKGDGAKEQALKAFGQLVKEEVEARPYFA